MPEFNATTEFRLGELVRTYAGHKGIITQCCVAMFRGDGLEIIYEIEYLEEYQDVVGAFEKFYEEELLPCKGETK